MRAIYLPARTTDLLNQLYYVLNKPDQSIAHYKVSYEAPNIFGILRLSVGPENSLEWTTVSACVGAPNFSAALVRYLESWGGEVTFSPKNTV